MHYYDDTCKMLELYKIEGKNVLIDFFAQLSHIRPVYMHAIVIAINSKGEDYESVLRSAITRESWMGDIALSDLRTHICFTMIADHNSIIASAPYVDSECDDAVFLSFDRQSTIGEAVKHLGVLIETCYYIKQIFIKKNDREKIKCDWSMFHDYITTKNLPENVFLVYELLKPIMLR